MRFKSKLGREIWIDVALACFWSLFVFVLPNPKLLDKAAFALFVAYAIFRILGQYFVYWDVTLDGLQERRFWRSRNAPWDRVGRIVDHGPVNWRGGMRGSVEVEFLSPEPQSAKKRFLVRTSYRSMFVEAARERAPQATFEDAA